MEGKGEIRNKEKKREVFGRKGEVRTKEKEIGKKSREDRKKREK